MRRKTANIDVRVEPDLLARIDRWRDQQPMRPSRTGAIEWMIEEFLNHESGEPPLVSPWETTRIIPSQRKPSRRRG